MAVTNKDQDEDVSQDLVLRVAISRGAAILSPELIEAMQAVPDMLIASRVDEDVDRVAAIPISVLATDGDEVLIVPGDALKLAFWLDRYDKISRRPGLSACLSHPDNPNLVGDTQLLAKEIYRREPSLRERFENPSWILPSLQEDARWDLGLI